MRHWIALGLTVVGVIVATAQQIGPPGIASGPLVPELPAMPPQQAGEMIGFAASAADGGQLITLIDATQRVMSVYHVDSQSGQITLRSVRRLTFDFAIEEFNANPPLPNEIRQMIGRRPPG